jgi:hypothetical protein
MAALSSKQCHLKHIGGTLFTILRKKGGNEVKIQNRKRKRRTKVKDEDRKK